MENPEINLLKAALLHGLLPWYSASHPELVTANTPEVRHQLATRMLSGLGEAASQLPGLIAGSANGQEQECLAKAISMAGGQSMQTLESGLEPILGHVGNDAPNTDGKLPIFGAGPSKGGEVRFPVVRTAASSAELRHHWEAFAAECSGIPGDPASWAENFVHVLRKHAANLPAPCKGPQVVALCDYAQMVAALSVGLWRAGLNAEQPCLLVGGTLSGIQTFLYDIISKNASKLLKGRSHYLQLLIDNILDELLGTLGLTHLQVVYASGGGFFFLAPHTPSVVETLNEQLTRLGARIFTTHQIQLSFAMSWTPFGKVDIETSGVPDIWAKLITQVDGQKATKFLSQMLEGPDFFEPMEVGGDQGRDEITNEEFTPDDPACTFGEGEKAIAIKASTWQQIMLGQRLRRAAWSLRSARSLRQYLPNTVEEFRPCGIGAWNYLLSDSEYQELGQLPLGCTLLRINDADFASAWLRGARVAGTVHLGGNSFPADADGNPLTFDNLAGHSATGDLKRLGVLRMDVDNLGTHLKEGIKSLQPGFAHFATLSRSLDTFFKGHLNALRNSTPERTQGVFVVYAGGDDLFIVGRWDLMVTLAAEIREDFGRWCAGNPALGISGGLSIVTEKFPIARAAKLAEQQEKHAKHHCRIDGKEKDAFSLFGLPLSWTQEYPLVRHLCDEILRLRGSDDAVRQSLITKIKYHHSDFERQRKGKLAESWRWNLAWDFARMTERAAHESGASLDFLRQLGRDILSDSHQGRPTGSIHHYLSLVLVAARWAELIQRQVAATPQAMDTLTSNHS